MKLILKTNKGTAFKIPLSEKQLKLLSKEIDISLEGEFGTAKASKIANYLLKNGQYVWFNKENK